jgi:murein biosynthesis integral membrane protein MurJ
MSLLRAGLWLSAGIALGRFAGFIREAILARRFGLGPDADVAVLVLTLPDAVLNLLVGAAMGAALVPALAAARARGGPEGGQAEVDRLHSQVALLAVAAGVVLTLLLVLAGPGLVRALAPGLSEVQVAHAGDLVAIALWAIPLTVLSSVLGAGLQERERFASTSLGTLWFNGAVILGLLLWSGTVAAIAWAMLAGAVLRVAGQAGEWRVSGGGWRWGPWLPQRRMAVAYGEVLAASAALLLLPLAGRWFASFAGTGAIAGYTYASKLFELPLQVLVTVFATALFPRFSRLLTAGDRAGAERFLGLGLQLVVVTAGVAAVVVAWQAEAVVHVAFHLPLADEATVGGLTRILVAALPCAGLTALLQAWYAAGSDTRTPLRAGLVGVVTFLALGWPVLQAGGLPGLAWLAVGQYALVCGLLAWPRLRAGGINLRALVPVAVAGAVAAGLCALSSRIDEPILRLASAAVAGTVAVAAGLACVPGLRALVSRHADP